MAFTVSFGGQPLEMLAQKIERVGFDATDMLYALNRQKSRIIERTFRGVDINGRTFKPYSTKGPYYYYPSRSSGHAARRLSAARTSRKIGGNRTRLGIKFNSYADFKRSLGRSTVDLTGPRAPHMMQAIVVKANSSRDGVIGIYGAEADRAEGHNVGAGRLPQREFFGWGQGDEQAVVDDLQKIIDAKLQKI